MDYTQRINQAIAKDIETIAFLAHFTNENLQRKLSLLKKQKDIASRNARFDALELLQVWEEQTVDAIILKKELEFEDNELLDMDMLLPEIQTLEMMENRQNLLQQRLSIGNLSQSKAFLAN
jgi:hypothetical protein